MYRLTVHMKNGNAPFFDFFTLAEAQAYRDERHMATNAAIKSTDIHEITFAQWRLDHV